MVQINMAIICVKMQKLYASLRVNQDVAFLDTAAISTSSSVQVTHQSGKGGEGFGEFTFLYLGWFFPTGLLSQNINIQQKT
jgi:hypothetical protein